MALIHEQLYQSNNVGKINLKGYIQALSDNLLRSYKVQQDGITLTITVDDIELAIDTAVSCGLIINELVSNSLKYAFPSNLKAESAKAITAANVISIEAKSTDQDQFSIHYQDNGVGIPESFILQNSNTLGLQLVSSLTEQLGGILSITSGEVTAFNLTELQAS